jgi:hypothetical protein
VDAGDAVIAVVIGHRGFRGGPQRRRRRRPCAWACANNSRHRRRGSTRPFQILRVCCNLKRRACWRCTDTLPCCQMCFVWYFSCIAVEK